MRKLLICLVALLAAGCAHKGAVVPPMTIEPNPVICPTDGSAPIEPEPDYPASEAQRDAMYLAVAQGMGDDVGEALVRYYDTEFPGYAHRLRDRLRGIKAWCDEQAAKPIG